MFMLADPSPADLQRVAAMATEHDFVDEVMSGNLSVHEFEPLSFRGSMATFSMGYKRNPKNIWKGRVKLWGRLRNPCARLDSANRS